MRGLYQQILSSLLLVVCVFYPALAHNDLPNLGNVATESLSEQDAKRVSDAVYLKLRQEGALLEDAEVQNYLNDIGSKLVRASKAERYHFRFYPILDQNVNAFAVPGGFIAINTGLLTSVQHESEVAAVLAHEIAHVTEEHAARMLFSQRTTPWILIASVAVGILAAKSGSGDAAVAALIGGQGLIMQNQLSFTQKLEEEADRVGMETLKKSGFDPSAMPEFFGRLLQKERYQVNPAPAFLRTHPVTVKRIDDSQARLVNYPYRQVPDNPNFLFVREKVKILQLDDSTEVLYQYRRALIEKRYRSLAAQYYGLAFIEYRHRLFVEALQNVRHAREVLKANNPMLDNLEGLILVKLGHVDEALNLFRKARKMYPSNHSFMYNELDTLINTKQIREAIHRVQKFLERYPSDPALYQRAAKAYSLAGDTQQQYYMQSEYYAHNLEYAAAVDMMQRAIAEKKGDFYKMSVMEARLKQLQSLDQLYK